METLAQPGMKGGMASGLLIKQKVRENDRIETGVSRIFHDRKTLFFSTFCFAQKVEPKGSHDQSRSPARTGQQHKLAGPVASALIVDPHRTLQL